MKIHGTAKGGAISKKDFGVAFAGAVADPTTWENLTTNVNKPADTNDDFFFGVLVDSTIIDSGNVNNVQINFAGAASSGTVSCCRWESTTILDNNTNAPDLLAAADHTYWSKDATAISAGMTDESVSESDANETGNIIGFVITDSGDDQLSTRFYDPAITGYTTYKVNSGGRDTYTRTLTFTITTDE